MNAPPWAFLKEISSDGNVNTVDIIYQSWPIFISLNPEYIKLLFDPIISYLNTGQWPEPYVIHDIGSSMSITILSRLHHLQHRTLEVKVWDYANTAQITQTPQATTTA